MLQAAFFVVLMLMLVLLWYDDLCPHCRRHALAPADVGQRCERCGWFER